MTNPTLQAPGCSRGEDVSKCSCREAVTAQQVQCSSYPAAWAYGWGTRAYGRELGSRPLSMGGWNINAACESCPSVETVKRGSMTGERDAMSRGVM